MATEVSVDLRYRLFDAATLDALRTALLLDIQTSLSVGQNDALSGRSNTRVDFDKAMDKLASIEAAIKWQADNPGGNPAFTSRYADFGTLEGNENCNPNR